MIAHWNIEYAHVVPLTMGKWLMFLNSCWFLRKSSSSHLQINPAFQRFIFRWIYHQNIQFFLRSSPKLGQVVGIVGLGDIGLRIRERSRGSWQSQWGWDPYKWMLCIYIYIHTCICVYKHIFDYIHIYIYYEYIYIWLCIVEDLWDTDAKTMSLHDWIWLQFSLMSGDWSIRGLSQNSDMLRLNMVGPHCNSAGVYESGVDPCNFFTGSGHVYF